MTMRCGCEYSQLIRSGEQGIEGNIKENQGRGGQMDMHYRGVATSATEDSSLRPFITNLHLHSP
jgi:hypothetical protein